MDEWSDDGLDEPQFASVDTDLIRAQKPIKRTGNDVFDLYLESANLQDIKGGRRWATRHVVAGGIKDHNRWLREYSIGLQIGENKVFQSFKDIVLGILINRPS